MYRTHHSTRDTAAVHFVVVGAVHLSGVSNQYTVLHPMYLKLFFMVLV